MSNNVCRRCGNHYPPWSACACVVIRPDLTPRDRYEEGRAAGDAAGYQRGMREAAEIARVFRKFADSEWSRGYEHASTYIAQAIEAKAKEQAK